MQQVFTPGFGILCHSSLQILSSSVRLDGKRWWTAIFRSLQRCSIGFKSGLWLGHSRTVTEVVVKPLLRYFSCVLRVIILLEGKPSAQSEVLSTLEKVFVQDIPVLGRIHLSLDCNQSFLSLQLKNTPQHDAATTMLHCWDCIGQVMSSAWFSSHIPLRIKAKKFYLGSHQTRESFRCFFSKLHAGFHVSCTEERLPSGHSAIKPRLVEGCSDG